jgi:hypothetical protein
MVASTKPGNMETCHKHPCTLDTRNLQLIAELKVNPDGWKPAIR